MRTLKYLLLALILVCLVVLSLANREHRDAAPAAGGHGAGDADLGAAAALRGRPAVGRWSGMVIGYLLEWLREHKHRRRASQKAREAAQLTSEVDRLRKQSGKPEDDVLALIGN